MLSIKNDLNVPVKFIGVGEAIDDLQPFNPRAFAEGLFDALPDDFEEDEDDVYEIEEAPAVGDEADVAAVEEGGYEDSRIEPEDESYACAEEEEAEENDLTAADEGSDDVAVPEYIEEAQPVEQEVEIPDEPEAREAEAPAESGKKKKSFFGSLFGKNKD